ncbi:hypothetical protein [Kineosporia sp. NBRC 101731]|uniref:YxiG-like protein n=1 Tax=Kineosporia sp. NBRC 101731 TaxID=3032199 RepID=UPI0025556F5C|nr:hypothetical protein [Kineosporia sp. NBRC 101731]
MSAVNADEIEQALDDLFDQALVYHGYTDYMRDYEVLVQGSADPGAGQGYRRYLFRHCPKVSVTSTIGTDVWARSLDEALVHQQTPQSNDVYAWGMRRQALYPGAGRAETSRETKRWSSRLGVPFYEVTLEGNGHELHLLFSDLTVTDLEAGYTPFVVPEAQS